MEHADAKDLTLRLFRDLLGEDEFADLDAGIVIQAYLRDSRDDLADLIAWSAPRRRPITVRLVKGAYWDTETVHAQAAGWPVPVFERKDETDANYERCARLLHDHHGAVRAAFASHNLRSLAYAITYGRSLGIPDTGYEIQMLYGMAEPMHAAIRRLGLRLRVYAPVGELVPGMAYLVRRLLENTSNESFVRHRFAEGAALDGLIAAPKADDIPGPTVASPAAAHRRRRPVPVRARAGAGVAAAVGPHRLRGGGRAGRPGRAHRGPGRHRRRAGAHRRDDRIGRPRPLGPRRSRRSAACGAAHADAAVAAALAAGGPLAVDAGPRTRRACCSARPSGCGTGATSSPRSRCSRRASPGRRPTATSARRSTSASTTAARCCGSTAAARCSRRPGEANSLGYQGKGVGVVIAPWNFPLAIPTGMTVAALVTGNPVVLKPAEQTPAIAFRLVEALEAAGLPKGVLGFLPGWGEEVGARLVEHPDVVLRRVHRIAGRSG